MTKPARRRRTPIPSVTELFGGAGRKVAGVQRLLRSLPPAREPYHPRDETGPDDGLDITDRHVTRATDDNKVLKRYLALIFAVVVGVVILFFGIAFAIRISGLPWWAVAVMGLGGTGISAYSRSRAGALLKRDVVPPASEDEDDSYDSKGE